mgnify:CR=1 FL=1
MIAGAANARARRHTGQGMVTGPSVLEAIVAHLRPFLLAIARVDRGVPVPDEPRRQSAIQFGFRPAQPSSRLRLRQRTQQTRQRVLPTHPLQSQLDQHLKTNEGQAQEVSRLQGQLSRLSGEPEQTAGQLAEARRQARQSAAQCEQLQSSATNWAAAVAARDTQLRQSAAQLKELAEARNAAVLQFNDLVERYHQLATNFEAWRQGSPAPTTNSTPLPRQP